MTCSEILISFVGNLISSRVLVGRLAPLTTPHERSRIHRAHQHQCRGGDERTKAARFYSPRSSLMRSQENLLVNINLFSPSQNPNDLLKYRAQAFSVPISFFQLPRKNGKGRLLSDYTSWENHCDHVDIARCWFRWYPLSRVFVLLVVLCGNEWLRDSMTQSE